MIFIKIINSLKKIYSPCYLYTLDHSVKRSHEGLWLFKEFGTHTFVKKSWGQLVQGDFLKHVNPKDIAFIAEKESELKKTSCKLSIKEEKRNNSWILESEDSEISISGTDFMMNREIIDKTDTIDAARIAYHTGVKKGREISALSTQRSTKKTTAKTILKLIK